MSLKIFYFHIVAVIILNFNLMLHADQNEITYTKLVDNAFTFSNFNYIFELIEEDKYIWAATLGGVVKLDKNGNVIKCYTTSDGLVGNCVCSLNIDNEGNKWFLGWKEGISMFDGNKWKTYNEHNTNILDMYKVQSITINNDGSKLFLLDTWPTMFAVLKNDNWSILQPENIGSLRDIVSDKFNNLWLAGYGVYKFNGTKLERFSCDPVSAIELDPIHGSLWVSYENSDESYGVSKYDGANWTNFTESDGLISNSISCIAIEKIGVKWFGSSNGVSKYDEAKNKWTTYSQVNNIKIEDVNDIIIDSKGAKWFGTNSGIIKFDNTTWKSYTVNNSSPVIHVRNVAEDTNDNIWVTYSDFTNSNSYLSKYDGREWKLIKQSKYEDDLYFGSCSMSIDRNNKIWFNTHEKLFSYDGSVWKEFTSSNGLSFHNVYDLKIDYENNIWVSSSQGVTIYNGNNWISFNSSSEGLDTEFEGVSHIEIDNNGSLWFLKTITSPNAELISLVLYEYNNQDWNKYVNYDLNERESYLRRAVFKIDNDNTKWIVTHHKIFCFDGEKWGIFDTPYDVTTIEVDNNGIKWFGTIGNGILKLDGSKWTEYNTSCGLTSNSITEIVALKSGGILAIPAGNRAISKLISVPLPKADINEDGNVDVKDLLNVINLISYKNISNKRNSLKSDVTNIYHDDNYIRSDIDNNDKTDLAEAIFVMNSLSTSYKEPSFPETVIKEKDSPSEYASTYNAFKGNLKGQCTWYAYGRVIELVDKGYLPEAVGEKMYNAFWGKYNRDAKNWISLLDGNWIPTNVQALPLNKRKKGLLAVWVAGDHGHVGFVEEISSDKTKYRLSDFNRSTNTKYKNCWYNFEGTSDKLLGVYPHFYNLKNPAW